MMVTVETTATADIREQWIVEVTPAQARRLQADPTIFSDLLVMEEVRVDSVLTTETWNEENREVQRIEILDE